MIWTILGGLFLGLFLFAVYNHTVRILKEIRDLRAGNDRTSVLYNMQLLKSKKNDIYKDIQFLKIKSKWQISETPEYLIYKILKFKEILTCDGHSEQEAIKRIAHAAGQPLDEPDKITIEDYLKLRLQKFGFQEYIDLGPEILSKAMAIATKHIKESVAKYNAEPPCPSAESLREKIPHDGLEDFSHNLYATSLDGKQETLKAGIPKSDLYLFKMRMNTDDEIWSYSPGKGRGGWLGVALVRNGKPIQHIKTMHVSV